MNKYGYVPADTPIFTYKSHSWFTGSIKTGGSVCQCVLQTSKDQGIVFSSSIKPMTRVQHLPDPFHRRYQVIQNGNVYSSPGLE